jgi:hypothetical protein
VSLLISKELFDNKKGIRPKGCRDETNEKRVQGMRCGEKNTIYLATLTLPHEVRLSTTPRYFIRFLSRAPEISIFRILSFIFSFFFKF